MNLDTSNSSNLSEEVIERILLSHKNPIDIIKVCQSNHKWISACLDQNSFLWDNFILKYYYDFQKFKHNDISLKDFYVLLYYAELLGIYQYIPMINKAQSLLNILPKIYDGDHLAILNACCNPAITSNLAHVVLYRSKKQHQISSCGSGYLRTQFLATDRDLYITSDTISNLPKANGIDPFYGGYRPMVSSRVLPKTPNEPSAPPPL